MHAYKLSEPKFSGLASNQLMIRMSLAMIVVTVTKHDPYQSLRYLSVKVFIARNNHAVQSMLCIRVEFLTWAFQLLLGSSAFCTGIRLTLEKKRVKKRRCPSLKYFLLSKPGYKLRFLLVEQEWKISSQN